MANPKPSWLKPPKSYTPLANIFNLSATPYVSPEQNAVIMARAAKLMAANESLRKQLEEEEAGISMPSPPMQHLQPHVERGERDLPACIQQVNKFNKEVLPFINVVLEAQKDSEYITNLEKIKHLVTFYDSNRNEKPPPISLPVKQQILSIITPESFKKITDIELLAGLIGKYKSKSEGNDDAKCSAFEELSRKLHRHSFFVKNNWYTGILSHIINYEDVNYRSPVQKSFFQKIFGFDSKRRSVKRTKKRSMKTQKRRSPKRSIKRKSPKKSSVKRRSAKSNKSKNKKNKKSKNKKSKKSKNKKSLNRK